MSVQAAPTIAPLRASIKNCVLTPLIRYERERARRFEREAEMLAEIPYDPAANVTREQLRNARKRAKLVAKNVSAVVRDLESLRDEIGQEGVGIRDEALLTRIVVAARRTELHISLPNNISRPVLRIVNPKPPPPNTRGAERTPARFCIVSSGHVEPCAVVPNVPFLRLRAAFMIVHTAILYKVGWDRARMITRAKEAIARATSGAKHEAASMTIFSAAAFQPPVVLPTEEMVGQMERLRAEGTRFAYRLYPGEGVPYAILSLIHI